MILDSLIVMAACVPGGTGAGDRTGVASRLLVPSLESTSAVAGAAGNPIYVASAAVAAFLRS
jgi:hypothetical protein